MVETILYFYISFSSVLSTSQYNAALPEKSILVIFLWGKNHQYVTSVCRLQKVQKNNLIVYH